MKRVLSFALVIITLLLFVSCDSVKSKYEIEPKEITRNGMKITVTSGFVAAPKEEKEFGYTVCLNSKAMGILALKEDKALCKGAGITSLSKYAAAVRNSNSAKNPGIIKEVDGLKYTFEYTFYNSDEKVEYTYFTVMYEAESAYWFVQFASISSKYEDLKPDMIKYAKSVTFVD